MKTLPLTLAEDGHIVLGPGGSDHKGTEDHDVRDSGTFECWTTCCVYRKTEKVRHNGGSLHDVSCRPLLNKTRLSIVVDLLCLFLVSRSFHYGSWHL